MYYYVDAVIDSGMNFYIYITMSYDAVTSGIRPALKIRP